MPKQNKIIIIIIIIIIVIMIKMKQKIKTYNTDKQNLQNLKMRHDG